MTSMRFDMFDSTTHNTFQTILFSNLFRENQHFPHEPFIWLKPPDSMVVIQYVSPNSFSQRLKILNGILTLEYLVSSVLWQAVWDHCIYYQYTAYWHNKAWYNEQILLFMLVYILYLFIKQRVYLCCAVYETMMMNIYSSSRSWCCAQLRDTGSQSQLGVLRGRSIWWGHCKWGGH